MEEYGESKDYPRGRGYGNDYMRGGEVFGGYGYKQRADYDRPRGEANRGDGAGESDRDGNGSTSQNARDNEDGLEADGDDAAERFPQDERAGGWDVPHEFVESTEAPAADPATSPEHTPRKSSEPGPDSLASRAGADAPEPLIEHTFGDTGGNPSHSRSYYVTQAQLQQRIYDKEREGS